MAKTEKTDKRLIGTRVEPDFAERIEAAAERDQRSVSSFVRAALVAAIEPKHQTEQAA